MKSVCLNMIVKNESVVIRRCLESVKPYIDSWVIVDTGSTDGTQQTIREVLKDLPGELYERPWVDFAHNRNEALRLAKGRGDYFLFLDADELLKGQKSTFCNLDADCYYAVNRVGSFESLRVLMVKGTLPVCWSGIIHEELLYFDKAVGHVLDGAVIDSTAKDGCRGRDPQKLEKDVRVMKSILDREPGNKRMLFHLACAYEIKGMDKAALEIYEKRVDLGGFIQEVYYCRLRASYLKGKLGWPCSLVLKSFLATQEILPSRAEVHVYLSDYYCKRGNYLMGYLIAKASLGLPFPFQQYRVDTGVYRYGRQLQILESAWRIGRVKESYDAIEEILAMKDIADSLRLMLQKNLRMKMFDPYRYPFISGGMR